MLAIFSPWWWDTWVMIFLCDLARLHSVGAVCERLSDSDVAVLECCIPPQIGCIIGRHFHIISWFQSLSLLPDHLELESHVFQSRAAIRFLKWWRTTPQWWHSCNVFVYSLLSYLELVNRSTDFNLRDSERDVDWIYVSQDMLPEPRTSNCTRAITAYIHRTRSKLSKLLDQWITNVISPPAIILSTIFKSLIVQNSLKLSFVCRTSNHDWRFRHPEHHFHGFFTS